MEDTQKTGRKKKVDLARMEASPSGRRSSSGRSGGDGQRKKQVVVERHLRYREIGLRWWNGSV